MKRLCLVLEYLFNDFTHIAGNTSTYLLLLLHKQNFFFFFLNGDEHTLVGAVGGEAVGFLEGAKMDLLAGLALAVQANGLDLDDVVRLLLQVPKDTRATGGVDLPNESLHVSLLPLGIGGGGGENNRID